MAVDLALTQTVVVEITPPDAEKDNEELYVPDCVVASSNPVGAEITTLELKPSPLNVKLCAVDGVPAHVVNGFNVPEVVILASLSKIFPVPDLLPTLNINVSVDSTVLSSIVVTVIVKLDIAEETVIVPSPLLVTPVGKAIVV